MPSDMLGIKVLRELWGGPLLDLVSKLAGKNGPEWIKEIPKFLRKEPCWTTISLPQGHTLNVLKPSDTVSFLRPFRADEMFFSETPPWGMKVAYSTKFRKWFAGKEECLLPERALASSTLIRCATGIEIIADLHGEDNAEVTLGEIWWLMYRINISQRCCISKAGFDNIFFARDRNGELREVVVHGYSSWSVDAYPLGAHKWEDGSIVVSLDLWAP